MINIIEFHISGNGLNVIHKMHGNTSSAIINKLIKSMKNRSKLNQHVQKYYSSRGIGTFTVILPIPNSPPCCCTFASMNTSNKDTDSINNFHYVLVNTLAARTCNSH